jgi:hypothetical protein
MNRACGCGGIEQPSRQFMDLASLKEAVSGDEIGFEAHKVRHGFD